MNIIDYNNLLTDENDDSIFQIFEKAFGDSGLGALLIKNIPNLKDYREKLLYMSYKFSLLPDNIKNKYIHKKSNYSFGWSLGKEKMKEGNNDFAKGSYYANPLADEITNDLDLKNKYPSFFSNNIWPDELPKYEEYFKNMGKLSYDIGILIIKKCDKYLENKIVNYKKNSLYKLFFNSNICKARLLHYYPIDKKYNEDEDSSCSWHLDHGCLTILTRALFLDNNGQEVEKPDNCGLHIKDRFGKIIKGNIPKDCLLCQIGETFQLLSGGHLRATPHCVKSIKKPNILRETFPVFIDCHPDTKLEIPKYGISKDEVLKTYYLPKGAPTLKSRLGETYADFTNNTLKYYYS